MVDFRAQTILSLFVKPHLHPFEKLKFNRWVLPSSFPQLACPWTGLECSFFCIQPYPLYFTRKRRPCLSWSRFWRIRKAEGRRRKRRSFSKACTPAIRHFSWCFQCIRCFPSRGLCRPCANSTIRRGRWQLWSWTSWLSRVRCEGIRLALAGTLWGLCLRIRRYVSRGVSRSLLRILGPWRPGPLNWLVFCRRARSGRFRILLGRLFYFLHFLLVVLGQLLPFFWSLISFFHRQLFWGPGV